MTSSSKPSGPTTYADRVFRSPGGLVGGTLLLALTAWICGDAIFRGEGKTPWVALAALLLVVPLLTAFTLRPAVFANDDRLRIRNPFRSIVLPWASVADVRAGYSSEVLTKAGPKYQMWAVPVSLRQRKRATRRQARDATEDPHGRTTMRVDLNDARSRIAPADQTVRDLRDLAERAGDRPGAQGEPKVRWAYEVLAPAAAGAVLLVVLLAVG